MKTIVARAAAFGLLLLPACAPDAESTIALDAEAAAVDFLSRHLFDAPETLVAAFVAELNPSAFPLRLVADTPESFRFVDIGRLRMVDGRAVVTALFTLDEVPLLFEFWLEKQEGRWRIAGYENRPRPTSEAAIPALAPPPPVALVAAAFRNALSVPAFPVQAASAAVSSGRARGRIDVRIAELGTGCGAPALMETALAHAAERLRTCWETALEGASARPGRLTFRLKFSPEQTGPAAELVETTMLLAGLPDCMSEALGQVRLPGKSCEVTARVVCTPLEDALPPDSPSEP